MTNISTDQALERWDVLSDSLREAIVSDVNSEFIWKTCEDEHIPEEKITEVAQVIGYVLLGFLHPGDVAQEISDRLSLNPKIAKSIEDAISKRILNPLHADIDKAYAPLSKLDVAAGIASQKIFQDVSVSSKSPTLITNNVSPAPAISKPSILSDVGWSKASSAGPGITLTTISGTQTPPRISPVPAPSIPTPPSAPAEPAPMMLHEDMNFKAAEKNASFTLSKPGSGAEVHMEKAAAQAPTRPAVLEFGGAKPPAAPNKAPTAPASNAMHYTELTLSLSAIPTADTGPRSVSQVTPPVPTPVPIPKPPAPSLQSAVPRPPQPPQPARVPQISQPPQPPTPPQNNKPIVKDFL